MMTLQEAANELDSILRSIQKSLTNDEKLLLRERLNQLNVDMPYTAEFKKLRDVGDETFAALGRQISARVLDDMRKRSTVLGEHMALISSVTAEANESAATLRLESLRKITSLAAESVKSAKAIKKDIDDGKYVEAGEKVDGLIDRLVDLQGAESAQS